ncbi:unnamed protein product [Leuciscus chuanchicus]
MSGCSGRSESALLDFGSHSVSDLDEPQSDRPEPLTMTVFGPTHFPCSLTPNSESLPYNGFVPNPKRRHHRIMDKNSISQKTTHRRDLPRNVSSMPDLLGTQTHSVLPLLLQWQLESSAQGAQALLSCCQAALGRSAGSRDTSSPVDPCEVNTLLYRTCYPKTARAELTVQGPREEFGRDHCGAGIAGNLQGGAGRVEDHHGGANHRHGGTAGAEDPQGGEEDHHSKADRTEDQHCGEEYHSGSEDHVGAWNHDGTVGAGYHSNTETEHIEVIDSLNG